jgi:hypothetical protein
MPATASEHLITEQIGVNEDGSPRFNHTYNGPEGGGVLMTGPVSATVQLKDGAIYDLTPAVIAHLPEHLGPLLHHIEMIHESTGRLGSDFSHVCTDACGAEALDDHKAAEAPAQAPQQAAAAPAQ